MLAEIWDLVLTTFWMGIGITAIFALYVGIAGVCAFVNSFIASKREARSGFNALKTVTFGDESSVTANRIASVLGVIAIFFIWGVATGSKLTPPLLPGAFDGETSFEYTAVNAAGDSDTATVYLDVHFEKEKPVVKEVTTDGGFAKDDSTSVKVRRSKLLPAIKNDDGWKEEGYRITHIDGQPIEPNQTVKFTDGSIKMTKKGSLSITPYQGLTMEALYLPPPEQVWSKFLDLNANGYQNVGLWENVFWSLVRVVIGFALGGLFGIPLGFAMGLNGWLRGWFDPIVEFMRPVPPLALIPLIIIWFGIWEQGKISLLFLASLWIMTIAARAGVSGVNISKVHAAYSLGASKRQLLQKVILPNSLPEIFTGARVAMGVCWGTVVAAELVAAEKGAGKMIIAASKFQHTDIVIVGIIIIGVIGYCIDILMRRAENYLIPWKGKG
ncbi:MAG: ABC transporter permease subunit [Rhodobacteraceae bacterium]|nr:ABC transporter permease subunit [Paracoccaceae bacterium]